MPDSKVAIRFEHIVKAYPGGTRAVDDVTFDVEAGAFVVLLGPSGCGKTTLLKIVNRLHEPTSGRLFVDGDDALAADPVLLRRRIGYVIQQVGLFPHMTVAQNVAVVPTLLRWPPLRISARIDELLVLVHLDPRIYRDRFPRQLSGGQQQRVGLARALAADPSLLLMDEPFGAVDAIERAHLQDEVAVLHARVRKTVLFVTHDVDEALRLADSIVVMRSGKVEQLGRPLELMARPANDFVSQLMDAPDIVRRFGVMKVESAMRRVGDSVDVKSTVDIKSTAPTVLATDSLRVALSKMLVFGGDEIGVIDANGKIVGVLSWSDFRGAARAQ